MVTPELLLLAAFVLDLFFGDPRWLPHPVRGIGWLALHLVSMLMMPSWDSVSLKSNTPASIACDVATFKIQSNLFAHYRGYG
jgi:hypothetical protein